MWVQGKGMLLWQDTLYNYIYRIKPAFTPRRIYKTVPEYDPSYGQSYFGCLDLHLKETAFRDPDTSHIICQDNHAWQNDHTKSEWKDDNFGPTKFQKLFTRAKIRAGISRDKVYLLYHTLLM